MCQIKNLILCFAEVLYFHMPEHKTTCRLCQLTCHCRDNQLQRQQIVSLRAKNQHTTCPTTTLQGGTLRYLCTRVLSTSYANTVTKKSSLSLSLPPLLSCLQQGYSRSFLVSENMTHCCQSSPFSHLLKPSAVNQTPHSAAVLTSTFSKTIQLRELCYSVSRER